MDPVFVIKTNPEDNSADPANRALFGRSRPYGTIMAAWKNLTRKKQILSVEGPAGIGKTALVNSVDTKDFRKTGRFIQWKFDQIGSQTPYGGISHAFEMAVGRILGQDQKVFDFWKKKLAKTLGPNARLMIDVIPGLESILGPQPRVPPLLPIAEKNRFTYVFNSFIKAITDRHTPLFLFIDDLQWADPPSLEIIRSICLSDDIHHILVAGACRNNETPKNHPWSLLLRELGKKKGFTRIPLSPLSRKDTCRFISHTLGSSAEKGRNLGEAAFKKTGGNPLFIKEFLTAIHQKKLLWPGPDTGEWEWDIKGVETLPAEENAALMITRRIASLNPDLITLLVRAASMGSPFDIQLLSTGIGIPSKKTVQALAPAVREGIIIPLKKYGKGRPGARVYKFAHDAIQTAVLNSLPQASRHRHLLEMGQKLEAHFSPHIPPEHLMMVTNLLNAGSHPGQSRRQKLKNAELNCRSGHRALDTAAYEPALAYFAKGVDLVKACSESPFCLDEALSLSLYQGAAQAAFLLGRYSKMDEYIYYADRCVPNPLLKTRLYEIKTSSLYARNRMNEAIDTALGFAGKLNIHLPAHPGKLRILKEMILTGIRLAPVSPEALARLPAMKNPQALAALRVLSCATLAVFYARPDLLPLVVFKSIRLSLKHGNTDESVFGYAGYGLILCGILNRMRAGNRFGQLALDLVRSNGLTTMEARTTATVHGFITHWSRHLNQTRAPLLAAHRKGLETGDHQFAAICATSYCTAGFHAGSPLKKLFSRMNQFEKQIRSLKQDVVLNALHIFCQASACLMEPSPAPWRLKGRFYDIDRQTGIMKASNDTLALFTQYYLSLMLCLIFGRNRQALGFADAARTYYPTVRGMPESAFYLFYDSLARLSALSSAGPGQKNRQMKRIRSNQRLMKKWALAAPVNIRHKYDLVRARIHMSRKEDKAAARCFEAAVTGAGKSGYLNDQALACELAGRFHFSRRDDSLARQYLTMAHERYFQWGALAKTLQMEERYPPFTLRQPPPPDEKAGAAGTDKDQPRDLQEILKAAQAIARETRRHRVLEELIRLTMANANARKAFVLLYDESTLKIQAFAGAQRVKILQNQPFDPQNNYLPASIIHYVMRSNQAVILENAPRSKLFSGDPYIARRLPLSILCIPIFNKKQCAGMLYLENDLIPKAFDHDRIKLMDILLSQAVVSIENAKLYEKLTREKKQKYAAFNKINLQKKILKNMSAELAMAEEHERKAIADDLHDSVTQTLALGVLTLKKLDKTLDPSQQEMTAPVRAHLEEAMEEIRSLTFQLSPKILYDFGLAPALEWLSHDIHSRYGLEVVFMNARQPKIPLSDTANITLYRAVRELLINVVKHAETRLAVVQLTCDAQALTLIVKDNGKGFAAPENQPPPKKPISGFGLVSIRERIHALNGSIEIQSHRETGTRIIITLPVKENKR